MPETDSGLQDLALRPLPAVDQKTILVMLHDLRGQAPAGRRRGRRSAKKEDLEQGCIPVEKNKRRAASA